MRYLLLILCAGVLMSSPAFAQPSPDVNRHVLAIIQQLSMQRNAMADQVAACGANLSIAQEQIVALRKQLSEHRGKADHSKSTKTEKMGPQSLQLTPGH